MKDVLGSLRIYPLIVAALATGLGIGTGWILNGYVSDDRVEDPVARGLGGEIITGDAAQDPGEGFQPEPLDFAAMLAVLEDRGLRVVSERALLNWDRAVIEPDGRIAEPVARALLLDEAKVERINQAFYLTAERLRSIELERMEVVVSSGDRAVFGFSSYERQGEIVRRALQRRIVAELGERDGILLWELMTRDGPFSETDYWGGFGGNDTLAVFEKLIIQELDGIERVELSFEYGPDYGDDPSPEAPGRRRFNFTSVYPDEPARALYELAGRHAYLYEFLAGEMRDYFESNHESAE